MSLEINIPGNTGIEGYFSFADAHCKLLILAELLGMKANQIFR